MPTHPVRKPVQWTPLILLGVGLFLFLLLWRILLVFILAAFFAFLINPIVESFSRKMPRVFSIISVYLILAVLGVIVIGAFAPTISNQAKQLAATAPDYAKRTSDVIGAVHIKYLALPAKWQSVIHSATNELEQVAIRAASDIIPGALSFFTGVLTLVLVPFLSLFMLLDPSGYKKTMLAITPVDHRKTVRDLMSCVHRMLWDFTRGRLFLMLFIGFVVGFGLYFLGMPYAAVFGILAGLLEAIPTFGPTLTTIIITLVALAIHPILALKAAVLTMGIQALENALLAPLVTSKTVGLDPVTGLLVIFIGGRVAGILGVLVAVPMAMIVKIVIFYFYGDDGDPLSKQSSLCHPRD